MQKYESPIPCYNTDGFWNKAETIMEFLEVKLNIGDHSEQIHLVVVKIEKASLFLGYDWLQKHNPVINWSKSMLLLKKCSFYSGKIFYDREPKEKEKETKEQEK